MPSYVPSAARWRAISPHPANTGFLSSLTTAIAILGDGTYRSHRGFDLHVSIG